MKIANSLFKHQNDRPIIDDNIDKIHFPTLVTIIWNASESIVYCFNFPIK